MPIGHARRAGATDGPGNAKQELSVTCPLGMPAGPGPRTAPAAGAEDMQNP